MPTEEEVYAERVIQFLTKMLRASVGIFENFGYFGRLSIQLLFGNIRGIKIVSLIPRTEAVQFDGPRMCQDENIKIEEIRSLDEIKTNETEILSSIYNDLSRAFQITVTDEILIWRLNSLIGHLA